MAYKLQIEFLLSTFMTFGGQMMKISKIFIDKQPYNCHILVINPCNCYSILDQTGSIFLISFILRLKSNVLTLGKL